MALQLRVLTVMGTRPEAIKMAPVVTELAKFPEIESRVLATGQHRQMLDQVLKIFRIAPDYDLDVMQPDQSPAEVLARILSGMQPVLREFAPHWVLVQGDTTTVLAAALAAAFADCRVGHVEAGLRTYDRRNPFPEELNRVLVDHASDLHFAPTERARQALLREGIAETSVYVTGNTVIDALQVIVAQGQPVGEPRVQAGRRLILVTAHRRENHGRPIRDIIEAIRQLALRGDVHIVYPVHRNPNIWEPVHQQLGGIENVTLLEPLDYLDFVHWMKRAYLILTDSGGIQEEAPSLGVPVLVLREATERPEAVEAGVARLVGTRTAAIVTEATRLLDDPASHDGMARRANPFGDGRAAQRIVALLAAREPAHSIL
jgi:UDP-N-acetylglucosamine 2-epimerase (non-hydrolysing)